MENLYELFARMRRGESIRPKDIKKCKSREKAVVKQEDFLTLIFDTPPPKVEEEKPKVFKLTTQCISYKCGICERSFDDETDLLLHIRNIHKTTSNQEALKSFRYVCTVCRKSYKQTDDLITHIGFSHRSQVDVEESEDEKNAWEMQNEFTPYRCKMCDRLFSVKTKYNTHRCMYRILQGFPCSECGTRFGTPGSAKRHCSNRNKKDRPFICHECGSRFKVYRELLLHRTVHRHKLPLKKQHSVDI